MTLLSVRQITRHRLLRGILLRYCNNIPGVISEFGKDRVYVDFTSTLRGIKPIFGDFTFLLGYTEIIPSLQKK